MAKMINLTIDDKTLSVPEGTLLVDAAKTVGVDIPVFCYHPKMEPAGMCRQCLVEIGRPMIDRTTGKPVLAEDGTPKVQFMPKLETACTNLVSEGMVVKTENKRVKDGQKEILEFLLTNHPLDCPICDKGGECSLQDLTLEDGPALSRFHFEDKLRQEKNVALGDLIFIDRERCIQCGRCIRFQDQIAGEPVLGFYQRGRATDVVTFSEPGFDSVFSGNTTDICPVGALTTVDFRFGARPWEMINMPSVCDLCPVGCNISYSVRREVRTGGKIVVKRAIPRQNEQVNEIWMCDKGRFAGYQIAESKHRLSLTDEQFSINVSKAAAALKDAKRESVIIVGEKLTNEDLFSLHTLSRGLGAEIFSWSPMGGGEYTRALGLPPGSNLGNLGAGDVIIVAASDVYNEAPIYFLRLKAAASRGATLVVAAARATKLDQFASFVVRYAYGDEIETIKGLEKKDKLGKLISEAKNTVVFFGSDGLGFEGTSELAAVCAGYVRSKAGKVHNGLIGIWQNGNAQGVFEQGIKPLTNFEKTVKDKVVYIAGANPARDLENVEALKGAKFVIAQSVLQNETTQIANVVFASQAHTEREGTMVNAERRLQHAFSAVPALAGTKPDCDIAVEIGRACGIKMDIPSVANVLKRLAETEKAFVNISLAAVDKVEEQWPPVGKGEEYYSGTVQENKNGLGAKLATVSGFISAGLSPAKSGERDEILKAVPVTQLYDHSPEVAVNQKLNDRAGDLRIGMNRPTAEKYQVADADTVQLQLAGKTTEATVKIDESIAGNVVTYPRNYEGSVSKPTAVEMLAKLEKASAESKN